MTRSRYRTIHRNQAMLDAARGGTLFIDEAYGFTPAKAGSSPNPSNQVLDFLLQVATRPETRRNSQLIAITNSY